MANVSCYRLLHSHSLAAWQMLPAMQQQMLSKFYTDMLADVAGSTLMMWVVKRDVECSCWQGSLDRLPGHDAEDGPCDVQQGFLVVVRPY